MSSVPWRAAPALRRRSVATRPDRREAILLAAEKLFAVHGFHAVSIRQIADEAGVPLALVGYYFGQKQELFNAIFEHWRHAFDESLGLLQQLRPAAAGGDALRSIVTAFVEPLLRIRASAEGEFYALLVARELAYGTPEAERVIADFFDPMAHAFIDALHRACPGPSRAQAAWAYQFALGALIHHIGDDRVQRLSRGRNDPNDAQAGLLLVEFVVAGIAALLQPKIPRSRSVNKTRRLP